MTTPNYLQQAHAALAAGAAAVKRAEARAKLVNRPGLAYAAANDKRTSYLVSYQGEVIGELHHSRDAGALTGWRARLSADLSHELGPFHTGRQAAVALLHASGYTEKS